MTPITATGSAASSTAPPGNDPRAQRLHTAANQFEAMLLQEMMKPLTAKPDGDDSSSEGAGQSSPLQGFGVQAVAESLAKAGALGFAKQIEHALKSHSAPNEAAKIT